METNRRTFLKTSGLGLAMMALMPQKLLAGRTEPVSDKTKAERQLVHGIIGCGAIGKSQHHFFSDGRSRLAALCDVDSERLDDAAAMAEARFGIKVRKYHDFRDLIRDPEIDVVHIATPPHWHAIMAIEAAKAGKDIFCEKPMTRTIGEGKKVRDAVKKYGSIFRINTWFRFQDTFYGLGTEVAPLKKLVASGLLGWPLTVRISAATGFAWKFFWTGRENLIPQAVPPNLDYDLWLGPAPYRPYHPHRTHTTFRGYWDYDGGGLGDMGQHYIDPVQYILGKDDTFPVKVEVDAPQQHEDAIGTWRKITFTYEDGCKIILEGEGYESKGKVPYIEGPGGKVYKGFECTIPDIMEKISRMPDLPPRNTDFIDCVLHRRKFDLDEDKAYHSCTIVNMAICALRLGRTLYFDPKTEMFINDDAANRLADQPMRAPWSLYF